MQTNWALQDEFLKRLQRLKFKVTNFHLFNSHMVIHFGDEKEEVRFTGCTPEQAFQTYVREWVPGETPKGEVRVFNIHKGKLQ